MITRPNVKAQRAPKAIRWSDVLAAIGRESWF